MSKYLLLFCQFSAIVYCIIFRHYIRDMNVASYLDLQLEIDIQGKLNLKLYDERDDFNFPIVNFPFLSCNYSCIFYLLRIYVDNLYGMQELPPESKGAFLHRGKLFTNKSLTQGYCCKPRHIKTIKKFYGRLHEIVDKFGVSVSKIILDVFETQNLKVWFSFTYFVTFT